MVTSVQDRRIDALAKAIAEIAGGGAMGFKHDATGTPATNVFSHGPLGNLTFPGVDPTLFTTAVGNIGILSSLPATPTVFTNPLYAVLTGVKGDTGAEKSAVCDVAPVAGLMKAGMITAPYGRYERSTPEMELNRLGLRNDRADPLDLALVGSPIGDGGPFGGMSDPSAPGDILTNEIARKFWELSLSFHRLLSHQLWTGDPANNSAAGGYKEIAGFDQLIVTGYVDAETNISLPSIDADVQNFGNVHIDSAGTTLVNALSYLYMTRRDLAMRTGMLPVRWVFAMRPELFWEVTKVWPCSYLSYMCNTGLGSNVTTQINAADQVKMRDELRQGRYLIINGDRIEVVLDDGITADNGTNQLGCKRSNIYLIPMSVVGGRAVTFLEYMDYTNPSIDSALAQLDQGVRRDGSFLVSVSRTIWCVKWQAKVEPRLVMRTPWLSGVLKNIVYCPTEDTRSPFPENAYFVDGGKTQRVGPSYYAPWQ